MTLRMFIKQKMGVLCAAASYLLMVRLFGYACKIRTDFLIFVSVVPLLLLLVFLGVEYYRKHRFYKELFAILEPLDQKYLITEMELAPTGEEEKIWMDILYQVGKSMREHLNETEDAMRELREYIELWIHEIKIPIAALQLMNYNGNTDLKKQKVQLDRLYHFVEQILFYARADAPEKDYLLTDSNLKQVIHQVLQENKTLLIGNHVRVERNHLDVSVVTDSKWLAFMLGQIVNNCVKYKADDRNPEIVFTARQEEEKTVLWIRDNGIGIREADLGRVFEKSFTGENGRKQTTSTGMGLYICKQLCNKLGHTLSVRSEPGVYTEVCIEFGRNRFIEM